MTLVWFRLSSEARQRWRSWLALAVLLGLGGGAALSMFAGARGTDSAIERFVAQARPWDAQVTSGVPGLFDFAPLDLDAVAALPGVVDSARLLNFALAATTSQGRVIANQDVNFLVDPAGRVGVDIDRVKMLRGRAANSNDPTEVIVSFRTAEAVGLDVGDTITANYLDAEEQVALSGSFEVLPELAAAGTDELRVVGVYSTVRELVKLGAEGVPTDMRFTPAALERHAEAVVLEQRDIVLAEGAAGLPAFLERVQAMGGGEPVFTASLPDFVEAGEKAVSPVTRALAIGGLMIGVVVLLLGGQAIARQASSESVDDATLRAIGFTAGGLVALRAAKALAIGIAASLVAVAFALAVAPLFPIGLAKLVEPDPGLRLDGLVLVAGGLTITAVFAGLGAAAGWWVSWRKLSRTRSSPLLIEVGQRALGGARPSIVAGVRAATSGGTGGAVSPAVAAMALGLVVIVATTAFASSLGHLTETPRLYGWSWDVRIGTPFGAALTPEGVAAVADDADITALAVGNEAEVDVAGRRVNVLAIENVVGDVQPSLISGRGARDVGEVVVVAGIATVGDRLDVSFGGVATELRVVGIAALPDAGAAVTLETLRRLAPDTPTALALARVTDPTELEPFVARAVAALGQDQSAVGRPELNAEVANFGRVERLPAALAALMGMVAVGALLHALVLSVRARRRELAVLKAVGFTRRQVMSSVWAHATTLIGIALVVAVPAGMALGRGLWVRFADELAVVPEPVVPGPAIIAIVVTSLVVANVAASIAGWRAAATSVATTLRTE
ncbi:MAG: FtsX-like permease family protein [Acidimicrobiales bacterium]